MLWILIAVVSVVWLAVMVRVVGKLFAARAKSSAVLVHTVYADPLFVKGDQMVVFRSARSRRWTDVDGVTVYAEVPQASMMSLPASMVPDGVSSSDVSASSATMIAPARPEPGDVFRCELALPGFDQPIQMFVDAEDVSFSSHF